MLGADHGGYVPAARRPRSRRWAARGDDLHVVLIQMVNLTRGGEAVKMSKRAGTVVSLQEVVDEVGRDATRFIFLTRRADAQLDFDLELAKRQTLDNPVFYVQYGHARLARILEKAAEAGAPAPRFDLETLSRAHRAGGDGPREAHPLLPGPAGRGRAGLGAAPGGLLAAGDHRRLPLLLHAGEEDRGALHRPRPGEDRRRAWRWPWP